MSIYHLGMVLLWSSFNPRLTLGSYDHPMAASDTCPEMSMSHNFHNGPHPCSSSQHTHLKDNPSLAVDKGFGLCEDHHLFHQEEELVPEPSGM